MKKKEIVPTPPVDPVVYDGSVPLEETKRELFCTIYTANTLPRFWGNGQNSYEFAYGYTDKLDKINDQIDVLRKLQREPSKKKRKGRTLVDIEREVEQKHEEIKKIQRVCAVCASRLLINADIKKRNGYLLDNLSVNLIVDRELTYLIQQREDNTVKMNAIEHYNKREQRIREKMDIKHDFEPIKTIRMTTPAKK